MVPFYTGDGTISPVMDFNGKISHLIGIVVDITARKEAEQQIRLQAAALNSAANAIVITDRTNRFEWVNPAFTELTGYTSNEIIGKESSILSSGKHDNAFYKKIWDTVLAGEIWRGELINKRKDGTLYNEENSITPLMDNQGNVEHFIGIKVDITERKRIEEQLRLQATALNTAANAVLIADNTGIVEWVNPAFTKLTGYSLEEVKGKNLSILRSGFHEHQFFIDMWDTLNAGKVWSGEIVNKRKDGSLLIQSNVVTPIKDSNNRTIRILNIFEDITERKNAEQQIRLQAAALDSAANAIVIVDRQGLIDWINPAFTRLTGYSQEECIGKNLTILRSEHARC